jgi:hypothetical protein
VLDGGGHAGARLGIELGGGPGDAQTIAPRSFGDDVEVDVEDGLMGGGSVVLQDVAIVAAGGGGDGATQAREDAADGGGRVVGEFGEGGLGFFGDDQGVAGGEGIDIEEGQDVGVLVDFVAGDLALDDAVEDGHGRWYGTAI